MSGLNSTACHQVVNRDKLQRAGEDNLFVRLLYAKDKPQPVKTRDEQEKLGTAVSTTTFALGIWDPENSVIGPLAGRHLLALRISSPFALYVYVLLVYEYCTEHCLFYAPVQMLHPHPSVQILSRLLTACMYTGAFVHHILVH